jgi:hypothetical protein
MSILMTTSHFGSQQLDLQQLDLQPPTTPISSWSSSSSVFNSFITKPPWASGCDHFRLLALSRAAQVGIIINEP